MKAIDIIWDVDHPEDAQALPTEITIPAGMTDPDEICDWLSDQTGFCHKEFKLMLENPRVVDSNEDHGNLFHTVRLDPIEDKFGYAVMVKTDIESGLSYVMQNPDGTTVFMERNPDETFVFDYDEKAVLEAVKDFESKTFEVEIGDLRVIAYSNIRGDRLVPGDIYIGQRNTGWQIAKCAHVNTELNYVMAERASIYSYDLRECCKVKEVSVSCPCGSQARGEDGYICPYFANNEIGDCGCFEIDPKDNVKRCLHAVLEVEDRKLK